MTSTTTERQSSDSTAWLLIAGLVIATLAIELESPLAIVPGGLANLLLASITLAGAAVFYTRVRPREKLASSCIALIHALLFSAAGSLLSYLLARRGGPLWDSRFYSWDQALGFDWLAYARFIDAHPLLGRVLTIGYVSLIPQMIVAILLLGFGGRFAKLRTMIVAAILSGSATILLSPLFPAVGNYVHLGITNGDFRHVAPASHNADIADLLALRAGRLTLLDLGKLQGIIMFPSYHAALAVVMAWGFWSSGLRVVRSCGCLLAAVTLFATPVDGGHYLVDVLAGVAVAAASLAAAARLIYLRPGQRFLTASPSRRLREASAP